MVASFEDSLLAEVVTAARAVGLELILVGNAGAAVRGAPVTTADMDFHLRDTALNRRKIRDLAERLGGLAVTSPGEPLSRMIRLVGKPVAIDLVFEMSGLGSFESIRSRASTVTVAGVRVVVASLEDIIRSKRSAGRPKDLAVLPILEQASRVTRVIGSMNGKPAAITGRARSKRGKGR